MESRRSGILLSSGVPLEKQGKLYWWQERSIMREYMDNKTFQAKVGGMKLR